MLFISGDILYYKYAFECDVLSGEPKAQAEHSVKMIYGKSFFPLDFSCIFCGVGFDWKSFELLMFHSEC